MSGDSIASVLKDLWRRYHDDTPQRLKLIDAYLAYVMMTGIVQFVYCCLVGTFPFNSFLSGFISTVGCFVLGGASLKILVTPTNHVYCSFSLFADSDKSTESLAVQDHVTREGFC